VNLDDFFYRGLYEFSWNYDLHYVCFLCRILVRAYYFRVSFKGKHETIHAQAEDSN